MKVLTALMEKVENKPAFVAIRSGLMMIIPVLLLGSATLVLKYFPSIQYQDFLENTMSGILLEIINLIYNTTFNMLSVFITLAISFCYARQFNKKRVSMALPVIALICFFILSGVNINNITVDAFGAKGMFIAIFSAILATKSFFITASFINTSKNQYADDAEIEFNDSVAIIFPAAIVIIIFSLINMIIITLFQVNSCFDMFVDIANMLFMPFDRSFSSGLLMVLVSTILWFFGIHGSNVLEPVMDNLFTPAINVNISSVAAGQLPTEIFTKQFFDIFVLMGGCGTSICLLMAIILFSKRKSNHKLAKIAFIPMLFNINELLIFGFPVVFNSIMFIPFITTPIIMFVISYLAMRTGIVSLITTDVNWTTPVLLNSYFATNSITGSMLQFFNIIIGILIYRPFILLYDRKCEAAAHIVFNNLVDVVQKSEESLIPVTLTELTDKRGYLAITLVRDLKYAIAQNSIQIYYQPQYNNKNICIGMEALFRWKHPFYGMVYPPLAIQLAREGNILLELEKYVLKKAVHDARIIWRIAGSKKKLGVNVTAITIQSDEYFKLLQNLSNEADIGKGYICLEITEQTALLSINSIFERLQKIKAMGYSLAIDDFSMGHTSIIYLQANHFDIVKLDGSLVRDMVKNPRSFDIIKSITTLSAKLGLYVIAEYVEEKIQVEMLEEANCFHYQGYFFSPALELKDLIKKLQ